MSAQLPPIPQELPQQRWFQMLVDRVQSALVVQNVSTQNAPAAAQAQSQALTSSQVLYWLN